MKLTHLPLNKLARSIALLAGSAISVSAFAGWGASEETIAGKSTWLYTPDAPIAGNANIIDGKRALMINLHGCAQSNEDFKDVANWQVVGEDFGMVVAIPFANASYPGCWDYDRAADGTGHAAAIANMAQQLTARSGLNIDPKQVYVSGLSSGGALALQLGCEYPHIFAGIGSYAGPSVGSDQHGEATSDTPAINVSRAISACNSLIGSRTADMATQVTSLAWGDHDKNGGGSGFYGQGSSAFVDVQWVKDNATILQNIYGAGSLSGEALLLDSTNAQAGEQVAQRTGKEVISLMKFYDVGHAWPGGDKGQEWLAGGAYMNRSGYGYSEYLTAWLFANNLRAGGIVTENLLPVVDFADGSVSGSTVSVDCGASDADGTVTRIDTELLQGGTVVASHSNVMNCSDSYTGLANGDYQIRVTATDNEDESGAPLSTTTQTVNVQGTNLPPTVSVTGSVSGTTVNVSCAASDSDGTVSRIDTALLQNGSVVANHNNVTNCSDSYTGLSAGDYQVRVTAVDNDDASTNATTSTQTVATVGNACVTDTLASLASSGQVYVQYTLYYATGSNAYLGSSYVHGSTVKSLEETSSGYWQVVSSCP